MTRAERLTRATVIGKALSRADTEGLDAVTIRALATELDVTPMALYWHFRNKEELLDGMVDAIYAEFDLAIDKTEPWPEQLRTVLTSVVTVLRRHPSAPRLLNSRQVNTDSTLATVEIALDVLARAGFSTHRATEIARHLLSTTIALVSDSLFVEETDVDRQRVVEAELRALPADRYPRIVAAAGPLSTCANRDDYFTNGIELLIGGVRHLAERQSL
ncbi:TetR family transcriptional regulator [Herbihabitans rhizosphaerae]|uniref:TetR family transcriptional regulator n=1 Tax=Herbihabitans rhizosphaerae TaxID=1872711 RepID=A0A4Q7L6X7_9PSEU|nr:TetR/AcrR family transcriptional regulator C-terminal domain-containing protein [Herbihabitans rhizosphaerae]RZS45125.1 TetR family transcriptional regulator [Herbihabitans rhizosphaerae]